MKRAAIAFTLLFLIVGLLALVLPPAKIAAQIEGQERQEKLSEKAWAASEERENRIKQELAQSKDNWWAGEYHYGDGLGVNVTLPVSGQAVIPSLLSFV